MCDHILDTDMRRLVCTLSICVWVRWQTACFLFTAVFFWFLPHFGQTVALLPPSGWSRERLLDENIPNVCRSEIYDALIHSLFLFLVINKLLNCEAIFVIINWISVPISCNTTCFALKWMIHSDNVIFTGSLYSEYHTISWYERKDDINKRRKKRRKQLWFKKDILYPWTSADNEKLLRKNFYWGKREDTSE